MIARSAYLCLALAWLSGCSAIAVLDQAAEPQTVFELRAPATVAQASRTRPTQLIVEIPTASGAIATDRILVRPTLSQIAYLPDARWSEAAPIMLQTAMVEGLLRTNAFRFVGRRPLGPAGDVAVVTDLLDFHLAIAPAPRPPSVEISLTTRLVRERDAAILATRTFTRSQPIADTSTPAVIAGFEAAFGALFDDLTAWIVGTL